MYEDPIVEEIRRIRDEHAARFDYDLDRIFDDIKRAEETEKANGRKFSARKPVHRVATREW